MFLTDLLRHARDISLKISDPFDNDIFEVLEGS
jgi:hypothetical protein